MTESIAFTVPGEPVAKGRARSLVRAGHVAHYTPEKTARYENLVALAAQQAMGSLAPFIGPVSITVMAYMGIAGSWSKRKKTAAIDGTVFPTKRPDIDNVLKAIKDGLNGVVWKDDSQVVNVMAGKRYDQVPRVEVVVRAVVISA